MSLFLDKFPKIAYNIDNSLYANYVTATNITYRIGVIKSVMDSISAYYEYTINDTDKPEVLAEKIYGNPEAHWIILYANEIYDPFYDWPLNYDQFNKFIAGKYGSINIAKTTAHHYEKVITRRVNGGDPFVIRHKIDYDREANDLDGVPYDTYLDLPEYSFNTYSVNGKTVTEEVTRLEINNYDWELEQNENKRSIKIIKKEYYAQILQELNTLLNSRQPFLRRLS